MSLFYLEYFNLRWLHNVLVYPGLHHMSHCPVSLLQVESFKQLPLQLLTQLRPNVPFLHSAKLIIFQGHTLKDIKRFKMYCMLLYKTSFELMLSLKLKPDCILYKVYVNEL